MSLLSQIFGDNAINVTFLKPGVTVIVILAVLKPENFLK